MVKIAVGSNNPIKIKACEVVANKVWQDVEVVNFDVDSGISDQPMNEQETIQGAKTRARAAREQGDADYGFGLEGSVMEVDGKMFLTGWVAVVNREGDFGIGSGGHILLPEQIAQRVRDGGEIGPIMDDILHKKNTKQGQGAVGTLTGGLKPRQQSFEDGVLYAMTRFIKPELYK
jgi:inosine/xanthosine triphosphatase